MKLHNLVNKLQQKVLEGQGDLDVVVASDTGDAMYAITPTIKIATSMDGNDRVIIITYEGERWSAN